MPTYEIRGTEILAHRQQPPDGAEGATLVSSMDDLAALPMAQLTGIWNAMPDVTPVTRFKDRKTAASRLWEALARLPACDEAVEPETPMATTAPSKQAGVIVLLGRETGATIEEIMAATGWQRHTVRGLISGALKKKLGLTIISEKPEGGSRTYRIPRSEPGA